MRMVVAEVAGGVAAEEADVAGAEGAEGIVFGCMHVQIQLHQSLLCDIHMRML